MKVCSEEEDLEATKMKLGCGQVKEPIEEAHDKLKSRRMMNVECGGDGSTAVNEKGRRWIVLLVSDLLDEDDFKLEKLRCESSSQLIDSLDEDDNHDECNDSKAVGPHAVTRCLEKSSTYSYSNDKAYDLYTSNDEDPKTAFKKTLKRSKAMSVKMFCVSVN
ncbi:hypothetical protein LINGRAHAP2_LOCUS19622 [Linum grandiflorum]